jgi:tetratricopeptide (TPR) repeat protein
MSEELQKARMLIEKKQFKEAQSAYQEALNATKDKKKQAIIWAELSWNYYYLKKYDSAISAIENVLELDAAYHAREDLYRVCGFANIALGKSTEAIENLVKSIEIDNHSEKQKTVIYELAKIYFSQGKYDMADKLFGEIDNFYEKENSDYWQSILFYRAFIQYYKRNLGISKELFEKLHQNSTDDVRKASAVFGYAFIAFDEKDYLKTINLCENIITLDKSFFDMETVGFLTAVSFFHLGRFDIFDQYSHQLLTKYPEGRYAEELKTLKEDREIKNETKNNKSKK